MRVGSTWSESRPATGGCPQGSILGVFLFNLTTDDLEEDTPFVHQADHPEPEEDWNEFYRARADPVIYTAGWDGLDPLEQPAVGHQSGEDSDASFHSAVDPAGRPLGGQAGLELSGDESFYSALSAIPEDVHNSTPVRENPNTWSLSPSPVRNGRIFDVGPGQKPRRRPRIIYSSEEKDMEPPEEPTTTCLGAWVPRLVEVDKYVDDNLQEECFNFENAPV